MRITTYLIDDIKGLKKEVPEDALKGIEGFKVYYTLKEDNDITYNLEDINGNKLNISNLNGYEMMYLRECYDSFVKKRDISDKYKNYITILDTPREIETSENERYKLFKEYAKMNQIQESNFNYICFIDKYSNEYEKKYNESSKSNPDKFDAYLEKIVLGQNNENEEEDEEYIK